MSRFLRYQTSAMGSSKCDSDFGFRISDLLKWARLSLLVAIFAGCAVGPDYKRPVIDSPPAFRSESQGTNGAYAELTWWEVYKDDTLQALIREGLTNNYDLRIAIARVEQAQALA